ncbi:hypothetical protein ACH42_07280 [Endozoicomonas sp. (ex Bugula neritina AB1)]|nr:hypothetical protein ACH42_07280 [Endozoicomonas sp. (ex Bugula neritina AB1)]
MHTYCDTNILEKKCTIPKKLNSFGQNQKVVIQDIGVYRLNSDLGYWTLNQGFSNFQIEQVSNNESRITLGFPATRHQYMSEFGGFVDWIEDFQITVRKQLPIVTEMNEENLKAINNGEALYCQGNNIKFILDDVSLFDAPDQEETRTYLPYVGGLVIESVSDNQPTDGSDLTPEFTIKVSAKGDSDTSGVQLPLFLAFDTEDHGENIRTPLLEPFSPLNTALSHSSERLTEFSDELSEYSRSFNEYVHYQAGDDLKKYSSNTQWFLTAAMQRPLMGLQGAWEVLKMMPGAAKQLPQIMRDVYNALPSDEQIHASSRNNDQLFIQTQLQLEQTIKEKLVSFQKNWHHFWNQAIEASSESAQIAKLFWFDVSGQLKYEVNDTYQYYVTPVSEIVWSSMQGLSEHVFEPTKTFIDTKWDSFTNGGMKVLSTVDSIGESTAEFASLALHGIDSGFVMMLSHIADSASYIHSTVTGSNVYKDAVEFSSEVSQSVGDDVVASIEDVISGFQSTKSKVVSTADAFATPLLNGLQTLDSTLQPLPGQAIRAADQGLTSALLSAPDALNGTVEFMTASREWALNTAIPIVTDYLSGFSSKEVQPVQNENGTLQAICTTDSAPVSRQDAAETDFASWSAYSSEKATSQVALRTRDEIMETTEEVSTFSHKAQEWFTTVSERLGGWFIKGDTNITASPDALAPNSTPIETYNGSQFENDSSEEPTVVTFKPFSLKGEQVLPEQLGEGPYTSIETNTMSGTLPFDSEVSQFSW